MERSDGGEEMGQNGSIVERVGTAEDSAVQSSVWFTSVSSCTTLLAKALLVLNC